MVLCPTCEVELNEEKFHLTSEEWVVRIFCPDCSFELETESNLVYQNRQKHRRQNNKL